MKNSPATLKKRNELKKYWREHTDLSQVPKFKERQCINCNKLKMCPWMSSFTQTGKPEYRNVCKDCMRFRSRDYSKKNRKKISLCAKKKRRELKRKYIEYLGGCCFKCNYSKSLRALTFHHKIREEKEFELAASLDWSWEKIKKELDKCQLLCFNCHMELEEQYDMHKLCV